MAPARRPELDEFPEEDLMGAVRRSGQGLVRVAVRGPRTRPTSERPEDKAHSPTHVSLYVRRGARGSAV